MCTGFIAFLFDILYFKFISSFKDVDALVVQLVILSIIFTCPAAVISS